MLPARDDRRRMRGSALGQRDKVGRAEPARKPQDRIGDFDHVARELVQNGERRRVVARQLAGDVDARCDVGGSDEAQHQLDIVLFLLCGVFVLLHIEVGEHPNENGTDVDAVPAGEIRKAIETWRH